MYGWQEGTCTGHQVNNSSRLTQNTQSHTPVWMIVFVAGGRIGRHFSCYDQVDRTGSKLNQQAPTGVDDVACGQVATWRDAGLPRGAPHASAHLGHLQHATNGWMDRAASCTVAGWLGGGGT